MDKQSKIFETTDYSKFKTLVGNREVNKLHVKKLKESFERQYMKTIITVNEFFEIIDGQHRLAAAIALKAEKGIVLPIYYIIMVGYGLKQVQALNNDNKNWNKKDYLKTFCDQDIESYNMYKEFKELFPMFGDVVCEMLLTDKLSHTKNSTDSTLISKTNKDGSYTTNDFIEGNLVIPDYAKSIANANKILTIKPYCTDGYMKPQFVRAMLGVMKNPDYSHDRMLNRLAVKSTSLRNCTKVSEYRDLIDYVYNYDMRAFNKLNLKSY